VRAETEDAISVTLSGDLDLATAPRLDDALRLRSRPGGLVVVDLRRLEFIDCAGARLLIEADRRIRRAGGRMLVVRSGEGEESAWFLDLLGRDGLLELCERPPLPVGTAHRCGHAQAVIEALRRQYPDAAEARLATTVRLLEAATAERDDLRDRVAALERELLHLVYQPPAPIGAAALLKARPA